MYSSFQRSGIITRDHRFSRNAGQVLSNDRRTFRISQDCEHKCGFKTALAQILRADGEGYEEKLLKPAVLNCLQGWMHDGYHTVNTAEYCCQFYFVLDGRRDELWIKNIFKAMHKLSTELPGRVRRARAVGQRMDSQ